MADRAPPTPLAMLIGTAAVSLMAGYMLGVASTLGLVSIPFITARRRQQQQPRKAKNGDARQPPSDVESSADDIDVRASPLDHAPDWAGSDDVAAAAWADASDECKLVLVVRTDLGMTKGKIAAQCSHATLACYKSAARRHGAVVRRWERHGQAKIALQVRTEDELLQLRAAAAALDVVAELVADAGRTQIAAGARTVLGIGPAPRSVVDRVTAHLKLL